jgi:hypothetical protein
METPLKLAVCIPCTSGHLQYLNYCLKSVEVQTRKPNIVVISISDSTLINYDTTPFTFPIEIIYNEKKLFAGGNRNRAAEKALEFGATILSFFDADDIMHPRRLELVEKAFLAHPEITGFLHCFTVGPKSDLTIYRGEKEIPWEPITEDYMPAVFECGQYNGYNIIKFHRCYKKNRRGWGMAQNGHITVKAEFWKENPYSETLKNGQDNHFSASILLSKKLLAYTGDTLSLYMHGNFKDFQTGL